MKYQWSSKSMEEMRAEAAKAQACAFCLARGMPLKATQVTLPSKANASLWLCLDCLDRRKLNES